MNRKQKGENCSGGGGTSGNVRNGTQSLLLQVPERSDTPAMGARHAGRVRRAQVCGAAQQLGEREEEEAGEGDGEGAVGLRREEQDVLVQLAGTKHGEDLLRGGKEGGVGWDFVKVGFYLGGEA